MKAINNETLKAFASELASYSYRERAAVKMQFLDQHLKSAYEWDLANRIIEDYLSHDECFRVINIDLN